MIAQLSQESCPISRASLRSRMLLAIARAAFPPSTSSQKAAPFQVRPDHCSDKLRRRKHTLSDGSRRTLPWSADG